MTLHGFPWRRDEIRCCSYLTLRAAIEHCALVHNILFHDAKIFECCDNVEVGFRLVCSDGKGSENLLCLGSHEVNE